jgi:biopolymer transport protein ExbB
MWLLAEYGVYNMIGDSCYFWLAVVALWGLYSVVVVWHRVKQKRFKSEAEQDAFLDDVEQMLVVGDFEGVAEYCDGDTRAIPLMISMAVKHRGEGYKRARQIMLDRFQRDVMSDIEYRLTWVSTSIKTAPMLGLFGTVFGMMGAFKTLATAASVEPSKLAGDINVALITTACGLAIAIPLMLLTSNINIKIAKMEDLIGAGLTRFFEGFKTGLAASGGRSAGTAAAPMAAVMQSPNK